MICCPWPSDGILGVFKASPATLGEDHNWYDARASPLMLKRRAPLQTPSTNVVLTPMKGTENGMIEDQPP